MTIYPAIDLQGGHVVRLRQGQAEAKTVYATDPTEPARKFREAGAQWLHVVDLDGAFTGEQHHLDVIARLAATGLKVQTGGGLRTVEAVHRVLAAGAARAIVGTKAATDLRFLESLLDEIGPERLAVGVDARDGRVAIKGWTEKTTLDALEFAQSLNTMGVRTLIYTDISRDGMLGGPNLAALEALASSVRMRIIASGGVKTLAHIQQLRALAGRFHHLEGVIVGTALYEGTLDLAEAVRA